MTVLRNHQKVVFLCDTNSCDEELDTDLISWELAIELFKSEGWTMRDESRTGKPVWRHYCEDCSDGD